VGGEGKLLAFSLWLLAQNSQRPQPPIRTYLFSALRRNLKNSSINGGFRGVDFSVRSAG
jgi:hypothetical protein